MNRRPLHIVQILPALDEGGVERGTVELNRAMAARGYRSTVISAGGRMAGRIDADGGRHIALPVKSKNPLTALPRAAALRRTLAALRPDIVHYRSRVPGWLFLLANRALRLPFVSTVHSLNSVSPYSRVMTLGGRVICPSTAVIDYIRLHYRTPREKIRLVPRGIDPAAFDPARLDAAFMEAFRREHGLEGRFVVLAVGRITPVKRYDVLIRATALAAEQIPEIKTVIVGGAEAAREKFAARLRESVARLGLEGRVVFAGSQKKMAEIYACARVLVSARPEAFGRSMAEALAMNCPVIAADSGGALDIVREGKDGWLVGPGDAEGLARRLVQCAGAAFPDLRAAALERFSLEQMVEKTLAVYNELA